MASDVKDTPPRPLDYIWNGQRITHYLNHARTWQSCPASERTHYTLSAQDRRSDD